MMKQAREISNFFYGQYFADGLRITIGCIVPVLVFASMGQFMTGTVVSLGALLIGLSDTPGAPSHRRNGMYACYLLTILSFLITISVNQFPILLALTLGIVCFLFCMLAVYNARAANIGMMAMLMMLIQVETYYTFSTALTYIGYYSLGAAWYIFISLSLTQVRPYRLAQQELAETIRYVADYIRLKANFYDEHVDNDANYLKLIEKQIEVNAHQENVRDLLFQSKRSIKDTTKTGRYLTIVFSDIVDLFEQSMATHYDYNAVSEKFGHTGILNDFKVIILKLTNELDHLAYQLNANRIPSPLYDFQQDLSVLQQRIEAVEKEHGYNTIALKKILINVRDIVKHINNIYSYAHIKTFDVNKAEIKDASRFIVRDTFESKKFRENLNLKSTIFRHAARMGIVMSFAYVLALYLNISENTYWILLTIMVILKPGFGLTKERNVQRLIGTIVGGIIGIILLIVVHDPLARFAILVFFFLAAYSLFRVNYIVAVIFMTPYVIIMLSFMSVDTFGMAKERILDTFLGGMIAFLSSYIIFPNWESVLIKDSMRNLLIANYNYLAQALKVISSEELTTTDYKLARKSVYIETANMGSTFQRLLTEPKSKQKIAKVINRFVIHDHILSSYSTTLMTRIISADQASLTNEHVRLIRKTLNHLEQAIAQLKTPESGGKFQPVNYSIPEDLAANNDNSEEAKLISEQLEFLNKIATNILKITHMEQDESLKEPTDNLAKL
ncbi:FUSC family protein [Sphingobacteriaceae bacterium WQ 2009]|uniref:FUSC family protein n=2 Tax=Rhinopithecimicrobium faecis TaxID=2820698 RepID=A0A8T4H9Z0_9SPHI|nr:FUSC family protein [Sphingobacteriaceae bacterium WQ 2009]